MQGLHLCNSCILIIEDFDHGNQTYWLVLVYLLSRQHMANWLGEELMTPADYRKCFARLEVWPTSRLAAKMLGVSKRMVQYYNAGEIEIPMPISILLGLMVATREGTGRAFLKELRG